MKRWFIYKQNINIGSASSWHIALSNLMVMEKLADLMVSKLGNDRYIVNNGNETYYLKLEAVE